VEVKPKPDLAILALQMLLPSEEVEALVVVDSVKEEMHQSIRTQEEVLTHSLKLQQQLSDKTQDLIPADSVLHKDSAVRQHQLLEVVSELQQVLKEVDFLDQTRHSVVVKPTLKHNLPILI
jgi:RecA/RadA recombinase